MDLGSDRVIPFRLVPAGCATKFFLRHNPSPLGGIRTSSPPPAGRLSFSGCEVILNEPILVPHEAHRPKQEHKRRKLESSLRQSSYGSDRFNHYPFCI